MIGKLSAGVLVFLAWVLIASGASAQGRFCATNSTFLFGDRLVGSSTSAIATISNCGNESWSFTDVSIDPATGPAYHVSAACATGFTLAPGAACTVTVTFAPKVPGQTSGAVWLHNTTNTPDQLLTFYGRGVDSQAGTATLAFSPGALSFGQQMVGTRSPGLTVQLVNQGPNSLTPSALVVNGPAAYDYSAEGTCNVGAAIAAGKSCSLTFFFTPESLGSRQASLVVDSPQLANLAILPIGGLGTLLAAPDADVLEFYYPPRDTYFLTASPEEAAYLDAGSGWIRTGFHFAAWTLGNAAAESVPVCRFTGTPNLGADSHFFTGDATECELVKANPYWLYEGLVFRAQLPAAGQCPSGTIGVVRFFRPGAAVTEMRHRYVIDPAEQARMRAAGWIEEGPVFCAPA